MSLMTILPKSAASRPAARRTASRFLRASLFLPKWASIRSLTAFSAGFFPTSLQMAFASDKRDPVAPAKRSKAALAKVARHTLDDDTPAHSFATLLTELGSIVRNTCRTPQAGPDAPTFQVTTTPNPKQRRALELLQQIQP